MHKREQRVDILLVIVLLKLRAFMSIQRTSLLDTLLIRNIISIIRQIDFIGSTRSLTATYFNFVITAPSSKSGYDFAKFSEICFADTLLSIEVFKVMGFSKKETLPNGKDFPIGLILKLLWRN